MKVDFLNPKILILKGSLDINQEELCSIMDIQNKIQFQKHQVAIIFDWIKILMPNIIVVEKNCSWVVLDEFKAQDINPIIIANIEMKYLENLARMTETVVVPNTNLLDGNFILGHCKKFYRIRQAQKEDIKNKNQCYKMQNSYLYFEQCKASLGGTVLLAGPKLEYLKIISKHLEQMLWRTRAAYIEMEYLFFCRA